MVWRMSEKALIFDARGNGGGGTSPTITGDHQNRITDYTAIILEIHETDSCICKEKTCDVSR